MIYTEETPYYDPEKQVIKLTLDVNKEHYPNFPTEVYVSEFDFIYVVSKLSGLDYSVKRALNMSDEEYNKTWVCWGLTAKHTKNPDYFGVNGNKVSYRWK